MGIMTSGRTRARWGRRIALSLTTILASGLAAPAMAQTSPHPNLDANSMDLTTGKFDLRLPIASIGSGQAELPIVATDGQQDNWSNISLSITTSGGVTRYKVTNGYSYDDFSSAISTSTRGTGASLDFEGETATYTTRDGTVISFSNPGGVYGGTSNLCDANNLTNCTLLPASVDGKSGMEINFDWTVYATCVPDVPIGSDPPPNCTFDWRLNSVSNSAGYSISWTYVGNSSPNPSWFRRATAVLANGGTTVSTVTYGNPTTGVDLITLPGGGVWRISGTGNGITAIRRPGASSDSTTLSRTSGQVTSITRDGITTGYSYSVSGSTATMVVTDAQSHSTTIVSDLTKYRPTSVTDALSHTTSYTYDSVGRATEITYPEGNKVQYTYDSRGNVTETRLKAKSGSGLSDIVTSASYPSSCTTPSCNEPDTTTDALGNVTDYSYDSTTGQVTSVKAPAAASGAKRPETRYSYTTNGAGISLLTGASQCQTGATTDTPSCVGTADEVKATIAYDGNLNVSSNTVAAGDNSLSVVTAYTYDSAGNLLTEDGPLSGNSDTTTYRYDADRRRVGTISPDPDGAGSMKRRAVKTTYNADGQPTVVEVGNVNGTTNTDWSGFTSLQQVTSSYDSNAFKTRDVVTASSTTYNVTDYSYNAVGRPECTALRMNSAVGLRLCRLLAQYHRQLWRRSHHQDNV